MFSFKNALFLMMAIILVLGETALVDTLKKCSVKDHECLKGVYQSMLETLAKDGAPELAIDKIDPLELKDVSVSILSILNITLLEGKVEGVGSCQIESFRTDIEQGKTSLHAICDKIIIFGQFDMDLFRPLIQSSTFDIKNVHGKGDGKIVLDKVDVQIEYFSHLEKKDDGVHFKVDIPKAATHNTFNVLENASFEVHFIDGDQETSKEVMKYLNDNWKVILQAFGKNFFDKAMEYINDYISRTFDNISTKHFITEVLTPYVKA